MPMTPEQIAHAKRATERAKAFLKPGDWLTVRNCGDSRSRVRMTGWDRDWICSRTRSDIHALHVVKVNGEFCAFDDATHRLAESLFYGEASRKPVVYDGIVPFPEVQLKSVALPKYLYLEHAGISESRRFRNEALAGGYHRVIDTRDHKIVEIHTSEEAAKEALERLEGSTY